MHTIYTVTTHDDERILYGFSTEADRDAFVRAHSRLVMGSDEEIIADPPITDLAGKKLFEVTFDQKRELVDTTNRKWGMAQALHFTEPNLFYRGFYLVVIGWFPDEKSAVETARRMVADHLA